MAYIESVLPIYKKGERIRRKSWPENICLSIDRQDSLCLSSEDIQADDWEFYQEFIDYNYVIENKCLCWFWDDNYEGKLLNTLVSIEKETAFKFKTFNGAGWQHCRPARKDELSFYEERNDAKQESK